MVGADHKGENVTAASGAKKRNYYIYKSEVEKVTKADVLRVAKKYLQPDKVQLLVVGKKEDFDKPLSTLGSVNLIDITIPADKKE
jgi:hypothetical protein